MTIYQLRRYIPQLKEILSLQPWKVTVRWAKPSDEFDDNQLGEVKWEATLLSAPIVIAKHDETPLHTLVHEMLHVFFQGHSSEKNFIAKGHEEVFEKCLNSLATLVIKLLPKEGL